MKTRFHRVILAFAAIALLSLLAITLKFVAIRGGRRQSLIPVASLRLRSSRSEESISGFSSAAIGQTLFFFSCTAVPGCPPCTSLTSFSRSWNVTLSIVHWDRRGAGKSFDARLQTPAFSVRQTLSDTYELTEKLRVRFHQQRIYLVGHSWGSYLGLLAIREHPEYYTAFIGMGVPAGSREQVRVLQREFLSRTAMYTGNPNLKARFAGATMEVSEDDLFECGGELYASRSFWPILKAGLSAPEVHAPGCDEREKGGGSPES